MTEVTGVSFGHRPPLLKERDEDWAWGTSLRGWGGDQCAALALSSALIQPPLPVPLEEDSRATGGGSWGDEALPSSCDTSEGTDQNGWKYGRDVQKH